jgi:uncharacterized membrane protein (UPF0182 family)
VTRPEIYFGEMTNTDVYVKTRQKEFNYPQGADQQPHVVRGQRRHRARRFSAPHLIALRPRRPRQAALQRRREQESRLLMRRNVRDRVGTLAPFLTFDQDPYIVVGDDGRLSWIMDAFTHRTAIPTRRITVSTAIHQLHAQQRQGGRRRLRRHDDVLRLRQRGGSDHRGLSRHLPSLFKDASAMPPGCASTCATPNCCSSCRRKCTACIT